jgi:phenylacetaldehyde dehydrogenase
MSASEHVQLPDLLDYIDGEFSRPSIELPIWLENPNTGQRTQPQRASDPASIERALESAWRCHESGAWSKLPLDERVGMLMAFSGELDKRKSRIAELDAFATGVIIKLTSLLNLIVTGAWALAAEQMKSDWAYSTQPHQNGQPIHIHRKPWGPALALVAWNAPATFAAHKAANALAAGCPTIVKPTEWAPYGCDIFAEAAHAAGLPRGAFQIVHGGAEVGHALVSDRRIRAVSFTGGVQAGRSIASACAQDFKPAQLEMGGSNPVIVLPDADLDFAAEGVVSLLTSLNGQWCRALGRLIVHESIQDALLERVYDRLNGLVMGDSCDPSTQLGPMIHSGHITRLRTQIAALEATGGTAHRAGTLPDLPGHFLQPTLVTGVDPRAAQDEIFGPVGTVHTYQSEAELIALANGTPYGLEAYIFAGDTDAAVALGENIHAGEVKINGGTIMSLGLFAPRPAWGLSGAGEEGTLETYRFFTNTRVVGVEGMASLPLG